MDDEIKWCSHGFPDWGNGRSPCDKCQIDRLWALLKRAREFGVIDGSELAREIEAELGQE